VLAVGILAVGANLPEELSRVLNIEPRILMLTLVAIVLFSLANRLFKLPSGLDKEQGFSHQEGSKALFSAIANGRIEIASRLINAGANINGRSRQGYTALMIAASHGQDDLVRLLLDKGADLTRVDADGRNALQIAREADRKGCVALLLAASKAEVSSAQDALPST
jgi:ankyrin repeat protein